MPSKSNITNHLIVNHKSVKLFTPTFLGPFTSFVDQNSENLNSPLANF